MKVLVVDDDRGVRTAVSRALSFEGYEVRAANDGREALAALRAEPADVIVLDIAMPVMDGMAMCRQLRANGDTTPILMLTARTEVRDKVAGLDAGADDYLVKPFALDELLARVRALGRRASYSQTDSDRLAVDDLELDVASRTVTRNGQPITLTRTEFELLHLLMTNAGTVLTRELILDRVWGFDFDTTSNTLDVYIGYLRRKTEIDDLPRLIHTVRGVGYVARPAGR